MHAVQPKPSPSSRPVQRQRVVRRSRQNRQQPSRRHRLVFIETFTKLSISLGLSCAAIAAFAQLLPYNFSQQEKLQEIREEVDSTQGRVTHLQEEFSRYFDPRQAATIMQEQGHRVDPKQRRVVVVDPPSLSETPESSQVP